VKFVYNQLHASFESNLR